MPDLRLFWLGTPEICLDGQPVRTDRRKAFALLAYLSVESGALRRDSLASLFWGDFDQASALAYLRRTLWEINQLVGPGWVEANRDQISIPSVSGVWVDVTEFNHTYQLWKTNSSQPAGAWLAGLEQAARLYRGDFLQGFSLRDSPEFEAWQTNQAEMLRIRYGEIVQALSGAYLGEGRFEQALETALRWVEFEPLVEAAHRMVMNIYALSGQRSAAIRQYERCRRLLHDELAVEPEKETTVLYDQIRRGALTAVKFNVVPAAPAAEHPPMIHLPVVHTSFVGRKEELVEVTRLLGLEDCRLLTLTGPGGAGKTRLAIQAATRLAEQFPDGVFFVPLAQLENIESIVPALGNAVGFSFRTLSGDTRPPEEAVAQLLEYLREKHLLLLTDNWEHLVHGCGLLSEILSTAPGIKILATSRERLNLGEEWVFEVRGLNYPETGDSIDLDRYSACQLFLQTARRRTPAFAPNHGEAAAIVRICRMVQGIPLAIELAASWVHLLSCQEIFTEISRNLDFLESSQRDLPGRHRSLRAVFTHSWDLLDPEERQVFGQLSIFQGGFTREAALAVAGASLASLAALVDKSLLNRLLSGRYDLHEMVKQYAAQKLSEDRGLAKEVRQRHFGYYRNWLLNMHSQLMGAGQKEAINSIRLEFDNLRRAWEWGMGQEKWAELIPFARVLFIYLNIGGRLATDFDLFKQAELQTRPLAKQPRDPAFQMLRAYLLACVYAHNMTRDHYEEGIVFGKQAFDLLISLPPSLERAWGFLVLDFGIWVNHQEQALALLQDSLSIFEQSGEKLAQALTLDRWAMMTGYSNVERGDQAEQLLERALEILRDTGDYWATALILISLSRMINFRGDYDRSRILLLQALDTYQQLDDQWRVSEVRFILGQNATWLGLFDEARDWFEANLEFSHRMGYRLYYASNLDSLGYIEFLGGKYDLAEQYYSQSLQIYRQAEDIRGMAIACNNLGDVARMRADWDKMRQYYQQALNLIEQEKDGFELDTWIRSIIIKNQGRIALIDHDYERALVYFRDALNKVKQIDRVPDLLEIFLALTEIDLAQGRVETALAVLLYIIRHSASAKNIKDEAEKKYRALTCELDSGQVERAHKRAEQLNMDTILNRWQNIPAQAAPAGKTEHRKWSGKDFM